MAPAAPRMAPPRLRHAALAPLLLVLLSLPLRPEGGGGVAAALSDSYRDLCRWASGGWPVGRDGRRLGKVFPPGRAVAGGVPGEAGLPVPVLGPALRGAVYERAGNAGARCVCGAVPGATREGLLVAHLVGVRPGSAGGSRGWACRYSGHKSKFGPCRRHRGTGVSGCGSRCRADAGGVSWGGEQPPVGPRPVAPYLQVGRCGDLLCSSRLRSGLLVYVAASVLA